MAEIIDEVRNLKRLALTQRQQGEQNAAVKTLQQGIDRLEGALIRRKRPVTNVYAASEPADTSEISIAAEIADLYGILGGTYRKQGTLLPAAEAYDAGFRYESNPRYRFVNSYNALNRLVVRILLCPDSLSDPESLRKEEKLEFVDVRQNLTELQAQLKYQVEGVRSNDFWAAADLALTSALVGDDKGTVDALELFASCSPPPPRNAYSAQSDLIGELAQLDTPRKESLTRAKAWLDRKMKEG